jgi:hypothetical protein
MDFGADRARLSHPIQLIRPLFLSKYLAKFAANNRVR